MSHGALHVAVLALGLSGGCACEQPVDVDASASPDAARPDAYVVDGGRDAGPDAAEDPDAFAPDAYVAEDAGFDCTSCRVAGACEVLTCVDSCEYAMADDGVSCGTDMRCVAGECIAGGCGDGMLGPDEGCDDGDLDPGDGCDADCNAELLVIDESALDLPFTLGAATSINPTGGTPGATGMGASGVDDEGNLVVTWARGVTSSSFELVFQRFDRSWDPIDADPVVLGTTGLRERDCPGVVPMARGWVLVWRESSTDLELRVRYMVLPPTGSVPAEREASTDGTRNFSAVRLDDGFVIAWHVDRFPAVSRARVFDLTGRPRGDFFNLAPTGKPMDSNLIAVNRGTGTRWTALWDEGLADSRLVRREYDGATAMGAATVVPAPPLMTHVASMVDDWLIVGGLESVDANTVRVAAIESGVTYPDTSHWASAGESTPDETVAIASLGGGEWFAVWRQFTRFGIITSAGTPPPRGAELLEAEMDPQSISLGRAGPRVEDGWILTYVARGRVGLRDRLKILRLVPDLTGS